MVVRTLPDERYGSPALRGALCQLNESAQNASQMPPRHACAALRCGACDGAAFRRDTAGAAASFEFDSRTRAVAEAKPGEG